MRFIESLSVAAINLREQRTVESSTLKLG